MQIGTVKLDNPVVLAPMAGVSDRIFRLLAKEMGCALVYTEMVSAKGLLCAPAQSLPIALFKEEERPIGIQIFGGDPDVLARGAQAAAGLKPDLLDINMGCPVRKVAGRGEGCALMRDPDKAYRIVAAVSGAVQLPVTVKMRKGWKEATANAPEIALAVQEAGAAAVTVHGRTGEQGYSGGADWEIIARVKETVDIPVIGSGDINEPQDAARMLAETGCDAVMIGRGALGNLWLIKRTVRYLETGELLPEPTLDERIGMALRHLSMLTEARGEQAGVRVMRKHAAWYLKGMQGAAQVRNLIMGAETKPEMEKILTSLVPDQKKW
ncbi:MAG: tRNA dihydrouridine synthase DusB [Firmicutes bacterium]|nr:tRNA dihydrouridine synthase DusB [Bacillota bacterium]